jgi:hypothetical protein
MTVHLKLATKGHVQEILSSLQPANAAVNTATVNVLEYGAIAATRTENAVLAHPFVDSACASLETAQYQL